MLKVLLCYTLDYVKLWHFKIVKIGQNFNANMEGFHRASHICNIDDNWLEILKF